MEGPLYSSLSIHFAAETFLQLNEIVSAAPANTLVERIRCLGELKQYAAEMQEPTDRVLHEFPQQPSQDNLHIIVQMPLGES